MLVCELLGVISIPLGKGALIYAGSSTQWHSLMEAQGEGIAKPAQEGHIKIYYLKPACLRLASLGRGRDDIKRAIFIWPPKFFLAYEDSYCLRTNFHLGIIIGFLSACWGKHIDEGLSELGRPAFYSSLIFYTGDWVLYSIINQLTSLGGLKSNRISLGCRDIGHHHLSSGTQSPV